MRLRAATNWRSRLRNVSVGVGRKHLDHCDRCVGVLRHVAAHIAITVFGEGREGFGRSVCMRGDQLSNLPQLIGGQAGELLRAGAAVGCGKPAREPKGKERLQRLWIEPTSIGERNKGRSCLRLIVTPAVYGLAYVCIIIKREPTEHFKGDPRAARHVASNGDVPIDGQGWQAIIRRAGIRCDRGSSVVIGVIAQEAKNRRISIGTLGERLTDLPLRGFRKRRLDRSIQCIEVDHHHADP